MVELWLSLGVMGVGMGMAMLSLLLAGQSAVPREQLGIATSLGQFSRSIGGAVGVALMGTVMTASLPRARRPCRSRAMELSLHRAFVAGGVVAALALAYGVSRPPWTARPCGRAAEAPGSTLRETTSPLAPVDDIWRGLADRCCPIEGVTVNRHPFSVVAGFRSVAIAGLISSNFRLYSDG